MKNAAAWTRAQRVMPGGVSSPVRAFKSVGGDPIFIDRAAGSKVFDIDGRSYIDYVGAWGPQILGHAHPDVTAAIREAALGGTSFGAPTERETRLAEIIIEAMPSMEMIRFVNSGTEATMAAIRLARGFTSRSKIVKFSGCYHGHSDGLLVKAGSGATTLGIPDSAGVPPTIAGETIVALFNDASSVPRSRDIAAIIVEPIPGNMGVIPPRENFLKELREICNQSGALLIFDEVMTGFRVARGGAQSLYGVTPDLTCLGKIIGGGLPVGAYGGRREIMERVAPSGPVYQAGTNSGNPIATAAGIATLERLTPAVYDDLENASAWLESRLGMLGVIQRVGSMMTVFFASSPEPIVDYADLARVDPKRFARFHAHMLRKGIYLPPSQFEAFFVSAAHSVEDLEATVAAAKRFS